MKRSLTVVALAFCLVVLTVLPPNAGGRLQWIKHERNPVLSPTAGAWDNSTVAAPRVLYDGSTFRMWYWGFATDQEWTKGPGHIGYASSPDGITWTKYPKPVLGPGSEGAWDSSFIQPGSVIWNGYGRPCNGTAVQSKLRVTL